MNIHSILASLAPFIVILTALITTSTANPLPNSAAAPDALTNPPHPHSKRTNHITLSGGLTLRGSQPLRFILPVPVAASIFESLYEYLHYYAIAHLSANGPSQRSFTLRRAPFELSFVTSDVAQARAVPWEFVRDFAMVMRVMSARGFTGCYDQGYWDEGGEFGIYVGLRIAATELALR